MDVACIFGVLWALCCTVHPTLSLSLSVQGALSHVTRWKRCQPRYHRGPIRHTLPYVPIRDAPNSTAPHPHESKSQSTRKHDAGYIRPPPHAASLHRYKHYPTRYATYATRLVNTTDQVRCPSRLSPLYPWKMVQGSAVLVLSEDPTSHSRMVSYASNLSFAPTGD